MKLVIAVIFVICWLDYDRRVRRGFVPFIPKQPNLIERLIKKLKRGEVE